MREDYQLFETQIFNKYFYPNNTLKNKLSIQDKSKLLQYEDMIVSLKMPTRPKLQSFSLQEIQLLHYHLFNEIYEWAGEIRDYQTMRGKNAIFCAPKYIYSYYNKTITKRLENLIFPIKEKSCDSTISIKKRMNNIKFINEICSLINKIFFDRKN